MNFTAGRWAAAMSSRARPSFRRSWMSQGLTSHQQLDAGVAARQHAGRKALKKSKRPFANYFKTEYRFSPLPRLPISRTTGVLSSSDAVRMMTDPTRSWGAPWERCGSRVRTRRKRQDVLEGTPSEFGEDAIDGIVERLLEIRFAWDREDGVLCTSLVPESLFGATRHCRPYLAEVSHSPLTSSARLASSEVAGAAVGGRARPRHEPTAAPDEDGEAIVIAGAVVRIRRRTPLLQRATGQPKRPHTRSALGFSGVDTVPSLVLDVSHGPFATSTSASLMTLRWKGQHRDAASVQAVLQLLRRVRAVPVVGLPPRSALLLLKALATAEVEEPALAVSLAIAMGENYHGYSDVECLELLRCLRRVAFVRGLPDIAAPDIHTAALSSAAADGSTLAPLYTDAAMTSPLLARYLADAAPFLVAKVWARLPEQSTRLLRRGFLLDWFDLVGLAIAAGGPQRLPDGLPNGVSDATYAAKYLFFHHTLGLTPAMLHMLVAHLRRPATMDGTGSAGARSSQHGDHDTLPAPHYVDEVREEVDRPLVLWRCAALLARIAAEALGDVVRHVGDSLHRHAALAAEQAETHRTLRDGGGVAAASPSGVPHPYPRFSSGAYQQMGCRRPKRVRVRLLPFEAFPRVSQCFSCPFAAVTERAEAQEQQRRRRHRRRSAAAAAVDDDDDALALPPRPSEVESTFASVLAHSPLMAAHIERACAALGWSTAVLRASHALVRDLPCVCPSSMALPAPSVAGADAAPLSGSDGGEWARESAAMEVRHALCYRYAQSAVQHHMDALFLHIPWGEVESTWVPMLGTDANGPAQVCDTSSITTAGEGDSDSAALTAAALGAVLMEDSADPAAAASGSSSSSAGSAAAPLSEAERRARAAMENLRERLEEFQVAVADLLEAHETSFPATGAGASVDAGLRDGDAV